MSNRKLIILSAPSGSGKTTIVRHLLSLPLPLSFSVSATSREPREGEINGRDYYFLSAAEFQEKISEDAFLEWEEVYSGTFYGTLKSEVNRIWEENRAVIFDVDVVGGLSIKKIYGDCALAIFVKPPSVDALRDRLSYRSTESDEKIATRVAKAGMELNYASRFDVVLINDHLETALCDAEKLVRNFLEV
jgi:guanylate kinase